jgi:hypothetical protein
LRDKVNVTAVYMAPVQEEHQRTMDVARSDWAARDDAHAQTEILLKVQAATLEQRLTAFSTKLQAVELVRATFKVSMCYC